MKCPTTASDDTARLDFKNMTGATIHDIARVVSKFYEIPIKRIRGTERMGELFRARRALVLIARSKYTNRFIGEYLKRSPWTIQSLYTKALDHRENQDFSKEICVIIEILGNEVGDRIDRVKNRTTEKALLRRIRELQEELAKK